MGEKIKNTGNEAVNRWHRKMPKFFRLMIYFCACVAGTAFTVNTVINLGGGTTHEWWNDIYPYLLGVPAGMAFCAKFTVNGGWKGKADYDKITHNTVYDKDDN